MTKSGDLPPSAATPSLHPALTVTNIRNFIPIQLDMDQSKYVSWVELFRVHCEAFDCTDHLESATPLTSDGSSTLNPTDVKAWKRIDAIVLQWIYGTISPSLLTTILKPGTTASSAWKALHDLFNNNKHSRALYLTNKFSNTKLDSFSDVSSYCQALKELSDQLSNVDSPVDNNRLVLQLIAGLSDPYDGVAMYLQQTDPLPDFETARSRLLMEESRKANQSTPSGSVLHAAAPPDLQQATTDRHSPVASKPSDRNYDRGTQSDRGRGGGRRGKGRGRGNNKGRGQGVQVPVGYMTPTMFSPWAYSQTPPCPYPTVPRPPTPLPNQLPGLLGPSPQAHYAYQQAYHPTQLAQAFQTMTLNPDQNWYMDTGATHHMSHTSGNLSDYFNNDRSNHIVVGNGTTLPIHGTGNIHLKPPNPPLKINNILFSPTLIKNLLSVRRLTTDNDVTIEFDKFGFSVKDYQTRTLIHRCDSTGDLYPMSFQDATCLQPSTFAALTKDLWHRRLGHPDSSLLRILHKQNTISVGSFSGSKLCQSCVFGKHIKLPFMDSLSFTLSAFDIIHSDLWTSPVLSTGGHRYYLVLLDDFTNYLWTYPLANKSSVFSIFQQFHQLIFTQFQKKIKCFQCDNGTEYNNRSFHEFFIRHGMQFRFSCPHTSSQNGKAERKIRSINNIVRTILTHASLPPSFWHHALQMATYLLNILPSKTKNFHTPTFLLYHKHPSYTHLRTFGCLCYPLLPSTTINKLQNRSTPCVFLGYPSNHRGYKCYDLASRKVIISRHVIFDEHVFPFANIPTPALTYDFLTSNDPHPSLWEHTHTTPPTPPDPSSAAPPPGTPITSTQSSPPLQTYSRRPRQHNQPTSANTPNAQQSSTAPASPTPAPPPPPPLLQLVLIRCLLVT
jgi:hypothetical protein